MRSADLFGLALSALWQQKLRTILTTLGVVFGSFALLASLSVREGVSETVVREYSRFGELRRIDVHPQMTVVKAADPKPPKDTPEVRGAMSEARRQRLARQFAERKQREGNRSGQPFAKVPLTPELVRAIAALPHVRSARPEFIQEGRVALGGKVEQALTVAAPLDDEPFRKRLIAGTYLRPGDERGVVVTEYLLYLLGVTDEADLAKAPSRKLRLEFRTGFESPRVLLNLLQGPAAQVTARDEQLLDRVLARLPEALDKMGLSDVEKAAARKLLLPEPSLPGGGAVVVGEEFTIRGVLRVAEEAETRTPWGWLQGSADVLLPMKAAEDLYLRVPRNRTIGFQHLRVEVDAVEHVKEVKQQIEGMGLRTSALMEMVERDQFTYRLIFTAMTVGAVVSLLVASLGITNTMLMSVLERVREIGVMKAVGARDGHIQLIFLVEGALVGLVGGLLGLLLGWVAHFPGDTWVRATVESGLSLKLEHSIFAFPWWLVAGVPVFACLVTTLAALYPARRAARVNPIAALRHD